MEDKHRIYDQREIYYTKGDGTLCRCPICGIDFRKDAMKIHLLIHPKSGLIHCRECDKQHYFPDERAASVHFEYHISQLSYTCSLCGVSAQFKEHMEDHLKAHHCITYHRCSLCEKNLHSYEEVKHHLFFHHADMLQYETVIGALPSITTSYCENPGNVLNGNALPYKKARLDLPCPKSNTITEFQKIISHNERTTAEEIKSKWSNDLSCDISSKDPQILSTESHVDESSQLLLVNSKLDVPHRVTYVTSNPDISCELSSSGTQFDKHIPPITNRLQVDDKMHNTGVESTGIFEITEVKSEFRGEDVDDLEEKTITWNESLHEDNSAPTEHGDDVLGLVEGKINTNESQKKMKENAVTSVHSDFLQYYSVNTKVLQNCPVCDQKCKPHVLKKHIFKHTGKTPVCFICKKEYQRTSHLYEHYLTGHCSIKPFECLLCDNSFKLKKFILLHLRTMHGVKYRCQHCDLKFGSLKDHFPGRCNNNKSKFKTSALKKVKKRKRRQSASSSDIPSKGIEFRPSKRHSRIMFMTSNDSDSENNEDVTSDDIEPMEAVSKRTQNDDISFCKGEEMSKGITFTAEGKQRQKHKEMPDLVDVDLNHSKEQKSSNPAPVKTSSVYCDLLENVSVNTRKVLKCPVCEKKYKPHLLKEHFYAHGIKDQSCTKCEKTYPDKSHLYEHYLRSHNSVKPFECKLCNKSFKLRGIIFNHLRTDHGIKYTCPVCNLKFESLKDHNIIRCNIYVSKLKDDTVPCEKPSVYSEFRRHYSVNTKNLLRCPICQEIYKSCSFKEHFYTHVVGDPVCTKCEITFQHKSSLYNHYLSRHTSVKPFDCLICDKTFKMRGSILDHLRTDHNIKYKCPNCKLKFMSLKDHNTEKCNTLKSKSKSSSLKRKYLRKNMEQSRILDSSNDVTRKSKQIRTNGSHSIKAMQGRSNSTHVDSLKEVPSQHIGPMYAASNGTQDDDATLCERGEMSTLNLMAAEGLRIRKDAFDLVEAKLNLIKSQGQKRGNASTGEKASVNSDFLQYYSVNTKKLMPCPICGKKRRLHAMREHIFSHTTKETTCIKCKRPFINMSCLYDHYVSRHSSVRPFKCSICNQSFKLKKSIMDHLSINHGIKYKCPKCNLKFISSKDHNVEECNIVKSELKHLPLKNGKMKKTDESMQITPSKSQSDLAMKSTSNDNHLHSRKKRTTEDTHLSEPMKAVSSGTHRRKKSTEILKEAEVRSKQKQKDVLDVNLSTSKGQKKSNATPGERASIYSDYQLYSVRTKTRLKCPVCGEKHKLHAIKKHIYSHIGKTAVCVKCKKEFKSRSSLKDHYLTSHSYVKPYECSICSQSFKLKKILSSHLKIDHGIKYKCLQEHNAENCMQNMQSEGHSVKALDIQTNDSNIDDNKDLASEGTRLSELMPAAYNGMPSFDKCQDKGKVLTEIPIPEVQSQLKLKDKHKLEEQIIMDVSQEEKKDAAYSRHKPTVYSNFTQYCCLENEKVVNCPVCGKSYKFGDIWKHFESHEDIGPICVKCEKSFANQPDLNNHYIQCHSRIKPFRCWKCGKCFKTETIILQHLRTEHHIKYKCPKCNLEYESLSDHNVSNCSRLKLKIKLLPSTQRKSKKRKYVIENKPDMEGKKMKKCARNYYENLKNTMTHQIVRKSLTVSGKSYKKKIKKASKKTRQKDSNRSGSFSKTLYTKNDTEQREHSILLSDITSINMQVTSSECHVDKPVQMVSDDKHSDKPIEITGAEMHVSELVPAITDENSPKERQISTGSICTADAQSMLPLRKRMYKMNDSEQPERVSLASDVTSKNLQVTSSRGQVEESVQMTPIDNHSYKEREVTGAEIHVNELMPSVSIKILRNDNSMKEGQISREILVTPDAQSQFPLSKTVNGTEQQDISSLTSSIADSNMINVTSFLGQLNEPIQKIPIDDNSNKQREMTLKGNCPNEIMPGGTIETLRTDNHPKGEQILTEFPGAIDAQSQFPKHTQDYLSLTSGITRSMMQAASSGSQKDESMRMVLIDNHSNTQSEITWTKINVNELMPAISISTNSHKEQDITEGFLGTADIQFPLKDIGNVDNIVDEHVNQSGSQSQKKRTTTAGEGRSEFYSRYYSINANMIQVCPICFQMCTPHTIKKHLQSHVGTEPVCIVCKMVFRRRVGLHDHYLSIHNSLKPFECSICSKSFKSRKVVLRHLNDKHDITYRSPNSNREFESKMDLHEKHHNDSILPPPIIFENFSNFEQLSEYRNVEMKYNIREEGSTVVQGIQKDIANHKTNTKDTIPGDKDCFVEVTQIHKTREKHLSQNTSGVTLMETDCIETNDIATREGQIMTTSLEENMKNDLGSRCSNKRTKTEETTRNNISLSNEREVPIPRQCGSSCGITISLRDGEEKGNQPWLCDKNLASDTQPITVSDPEFILKNTLPSNCNTDECMEVLQNNSFANVDERRRDYFSSADTPEFLDSGNHHNKKEFMLQKSTSDVQYNWNLNGNNEEYVLALEKEVYFVNQWMTE